MNLESPNANRKEEDTNIRDIPSTECNEISLLLCGLQCTFARVPAGYHQGQRLPDGTDEVVGLAIIRFIPGVTVTLYARFDEMEVSQRGMFGFQRRDEMRELRYRVVHPHVCMITT